MGRIAAVEAAFSIVLMLAVFAAGHRITTRLRGWVKSSGRPKFRLAVCTVTVAVLGALLVFASIPATEAALTSRAPIFIGNDDFFNPDNGVNGGGSGTELDPYIIENWVINASEAHGIRIRNTTKYFVIRNCLVENGGDSHWGIYLDNVRNGRIENNTCSNNDHGIHLESSYNNTISNNTFSSSDHGIHLDSSSNNTISNNICLNNEHGIHLRSSTGITVFHNHLLNNTENNAYDDNANSWDENGEGNYWDDWQPPDHPDADGDGIIDEPRQIAGGANQDNYPLVLRPSPTPTTSTTTTTTTTSPTTTTTSPTTTMTITTSPPSNRPPTADANGPYEVKENENVELDGNRSSDPDGDMLTFSWTIKIDPTGGASLTGSNTATPTFHAPDNVYVAVDVIVELTVDDGQGHTGSDTAVVTIKPAVPYPELPFATYAGMVISTVAILTTIVVGYSVYLVRRERL